MHLRQQASDDSVRLQYAGGVGIPESHASAPEIVTLSRAALAGDETSDEVWPFAEAMRTRRPVVVEDISELIQGYPVRVWDELPTSAIVIPLALNSEQGSPGAVLVLGLSCRLKYDAAYAAFIVRPTLRPS